MIDTKTFGAELKKYGFDFFSGVPCSFLKDLINFAINDCQYIIAANEGDAVATCAGAYLGGRKPVFLCQNSGLTNAVSPLTSLNKIFRIPVLGFVSLRGEPGLPDEPQHELMGRITTEMLDLMQIKWEYLSRDFATATDQLKRAHEYFVRAESFFFVVGKDTFSKVVLEEQTHQLQVNRKKIPWARPDTLPTRMEVLAQLNDLKERNILFLATTGKTGRELYEIEDAPNHFYMVGSMGCVSPLALGLALVRKNKLVVAIDGDGAALMRLGALATNAFYSPENLFHVLLDNNSYDSTGGQMTISQNIDFIELAAAAGYTNTFYIHDLKELSESFIQWKQNGGLTFIYLKIAKGSKENLGRPKIQPFQVKERLMSFIENPVDQSLASGMNQ